MVLEQNVPNFMVEGQQRKRRRLSWRQREDAGGPSTLTDLPHEMLCAVLARLPAHDAAVARAACSKLKEAGDVVLDLSLNRLVARAEAQLSAVCAEEYMAGVTGDAGNCHHLSHVSWAVSYVLQQARLLRAVCARYLRSWPQAGEPCSQYMSFYGGLVLDEARQVLQGAARCVRERQLHMQLLHVGQLRHLVERWVSHFHEHVEPQLLAAASAGLAPLPGCKPLDLLDCCADVERHLEVSWDETGEWCFGRGRYVLHHTTLRVGGGGCQLLSAKRQRSLHGGLSRLASRSAQYSSGHPRVWQELLACRLIGTDKWAETASLQDQAFLMSLQRHSIFAEAGVWLDEEESDAEIDNAPEEGGEEQQAAAEEQGEEQGEEQEEAQGEEQAEHQQGDNGHLPVQELDEDEDEDMGEEEEEVGGVKDNVAVEVRFTCRRHLAPLGFMAGPPPSRPPVPVRMSGWDSRELRQPDLQLRMVFHCPAAPELGHFCCLIQHGGRLRPPATGVCRWFSCGDAEHLQQPPDHVGDVIPTEEDG